MVEQKRSETDSPQHDHPKEVFMMTPIAYILLEKDGKILLSKRTRKSKLNGRWGLPAGHIEEGETSVQTAAREAREELGIIIDESDLTPIHTLHLKDPDGQRAGFIVKARKWIGKPKNAEPEKCDAIMWANRDRLPRKISPHIVLALSNIRKGIKVTEFGWDQPQNRPEPEK